MTPARLNCDTKTLNASKMQKLSAQSGTKSSSCSCFHTNEMMSPNCRKLFSISEQKWEKSTSARPHKHRTNTIRRSKDSTHSPRRRDWRAAQLELRDLRWETERERERDDCVLVNKKLHADAACFRLCFDQLSVMQKQKRTTYSEHQEYFYFYFCSCYAIKAKRVKLEISIRFNSLSQALNAAFLCICHIRK